MTIPMETQLLLLLESFLLGASAGLLYDFFRAIRWYYRFGIFMTALCDLLFWLALLAALFEFGIARAAGQNRFYLLAGTIGGSVFYNLTVSVLVRAILRYFLSGLTAIRKGICSTAVRAKERIQKAAIPEKMQTFLKKVCPTPFPFWAKWYKIKHNAAALKGRQRKWRNEKNGVHRF